MRRISIVTICAGVWLVTNASASVIYNNLTPNNLMAVATRPGGVATTEIEAADDFLLSGAGIINSASFVGLIVPGATGTPTISDVVVEIYRVLGVLNNFPNLSSVLLQPGLIFGE